MLSTFYWLQAEEGGGPAGGGGRRAGEHRTAAVASEAEIGILLSSARQSPPLGCQSEWWTAAAGWRRGLKGPAQLHHVFCDLSPFVSRKKGSNAAWNHDFHNHIFNRKSSDCIIIDPDAEEETYELKVFWMIFCMKTAVIVHKAEPMNYSAQTTCAPIHSSWYCSSQQP